MILRTTIIPAIYISLYCFKPLSLFSRECVSVYSFISDAYMPNTLLSVYIVIDKHFYVLSIYVYDIELL